MTYGYHEHPYCSWFPKHGYWLLHTSGTDAAGFVANTHNRVTWCILLIGTVQS